MFEKPSSCIANSQSTTKPFKLNVVIEAQAFHAKPTSTKSTKMQIQVQPFDIDLYREHRSHTSPILLLTTPHFAPNVKSQQM